MNHQSTVFAGLSLLLLTSAPGASNFISGHGDLGIGFEGGGLELHYHLGEDQPAILSGDVNGPVNDQEFEPDDVVVVVGNPQVRPLSAAFDFLGAPAGELIYLLPEDELAAAGAGVPFLGIGTEELVAADWTGDLSLSLTSSAGPGDFSLYDFDGALSVFMSTADNITGTFVIPAGGHTHANWAFTAPGTYDLEFTVTGTHSTLGALSDTANYQFRVVPEPSTGLLLSLAGLVTVMRRKRR